MDLDINNVKNGIFTDRGSVAHPANRSKSALGAAVSSIAALGPKVPQGSELIVYYTGHDYDHGNWIIPSPKGEVVTPVDMMSWLGDHQMPVTIVSDCCFSGRWCNITTSEQPQSGPKTSQQLRIIAACRSGLSYIGELLGQFASGVVSSKQCPSQKLIQYSHGSVLQF